MFHLRENLIVWSWTWSGCWSWSWGSEWGGSWVVNNSSSVNWIWSWYSYGLSNWNWHWLCDWNVLNDWNFVWYLSFPKQKIISFFYGEEIFLNQIFFYWIWSRHWNFDWYWDFNMNWIWSSDWNFHWLWNFYVDLFFNELKQNIRFFSKLILKKKKIIFGVNIFSPF